MDNPFNEIARQQQLLIRYGTEVNPGKWQGIELDPRQTMLESTQLSLKLPIPNSQTALESSCQPDMPWAEDHFRERVAGEPCNPGKTYKYWPYNTFKDEGDEFKNEGSKFSHTYMERFWPVLTDSGKIRRGIRYRYGDLADVIALLKSNPETRQAFLPVYFPEDTGATHGKRIPCTIGYQFIYRHNQLNVIYFIRSCDAYRHFRNDIYLTMRLAQWVAKETGLDLMPGRPLGTLQMVIGSFHIFKSDIYRLKKDPRYRSIIEP